MKNVNSEQKLQLIQQIRSRYNEDRYDMRDRERILYGRESIRPWEEDGADPEQEMPQSSFRLRILLAVLLFAVVVTIDTNGTSLWGLTAEKIYQIISADYEDEIEEWVETLSQGR